MAQRGRTEPKRNLTLECDVPSGVEDVAAAEIRERVPSVTRLGFESGKVIFELARRDLRAILGVQTIAGAWIVVASDSRRPSAMRHGLVEAVTMVRGLHPLGAVRAIEVNAPGLHPASIDELRRSIASSRRIRTEGAALLVRVRRRASRVGWEALVAVAPHPLADRPYRVSRFRGSLNAPLAAAIVRLTCPAPSDRFLNVACGSATIAIERALSADAASVTGIDISPGALSHAVKNVAASGRQIDLVVADGRRLPFASARFDAVCSDLPWGHLVGSHDANAVEYEPLLVEMARVARRRARAVVLTNELRLTQRALGTLAALWRLDRLVRVEQGGAHPGLFVLRRA